MISEKASETSGFPAVQTAPATLPSLWLSVLVLLAGGTALGLAAIPPFVLDRPLGIAPIEKTDPPPAERQGGVNFKVGKFEVNVGGKVEPPPPIVPPPTPLKWFFVSAIALALPTIVVGAIAWHRESHSALAGTGITLAVLAVAWQYIIIGIVIGVAVAILLLLLGSLS